MADQTLENLFEVMYDIGKILVEDDIDDFPWNPYEGGPGHVMGMPHHGMIGLILQQVSLLGGLMSLIAPQNEVRDFEEVSEKIERLYQML